MKTATLAVVAAATVGLAAAHPSAHHGHSQFHAKRDLDLVVVYELNGHPISAAEVQMGLKNGSLLLAPNGQIAAKPTEAPKPKSSAPAPAPAPVASSAPAKVADNLLAKPAVPAPAPKKPETPKPAATSSSGHGVDSEFPDGTLSCNEFPSDYGAVALPYLGLNGWSGIQDCGESSGPFSDIMTLVKGMTLDKEGAFYSYACPAGYQKSQWPQEQGATGQSVGGLRCQNGKLWLTNPSLSKKLCIPGTDKVKVTIENKMSTNAAVCRTDYPGTESETIPLDSQPGSTNPLTCPDANNYYNWQGMHTSAQYYVNPAGVGIEDACQWGSPDKPYGNYAPINLGVGYSAGSGWLSIFGNNPTTDAKLDFNIEIVGDGSMIGKCKYENGQFFTGDNYETTSPSGCTVNVPSGSAKYVFSR